MAPIKYPYLLSKWVWERRSGYTSRGSDLVRNSVAKLRKTNDTISADQSGLQEATDIKLGKGRRQNCVTLLVWSRDTLLLCFTTWPPKNPTSELIWVPDVQHSVVFFVLSGVLFVHSPTWLASHFLDSSNTDGWTLFLPWLSEFWLTVFLSSDMVDRRVTDWLISSSESGIGILTETLPTFCPLRIRSNVYIIDWLNKTSGCNDKSTTTNSECTN